MLEQKKETDSMMLNPFSIKDEKKKESKLFMQELAQETKKTIFPTKSNISENDTQIMNSLKILEVGLISKEKDFSKFWTESHKELSEKLLSLTEIDYVDLGSHYLNILQNKTTANSWFSTTHNYHLKKNLSETLFPSYMFSPVGFTDSGSILVKSRKIRIYPKHEDINIFKKYLGLTRYWFNKAIEYLKKPETKASIMEVRKIQKEEHPVWAFDCPQRIREHAMSDACNAVKNAKLKYRSTKVFQEVHYRRKKDTKQRFGFDKIALKQFSVFAGKNIVKFHSTEEIDVEKEGTEIVRENGRWFVVIPVTASIKIPDNQRLGIVALDPGVRTFQTYFNPFTSGKIGSNDFSRIYRICLVMDKIISKMTSADYNSRRRLKQARQRLSWKIKDLISDIHHKTALFLVSNFDIILIPTFETSSMVTKLKSKTARTMLTWAHYRFKEFLKFKAKEYSSVVIDVNEAYTSRTCSFCGRDQKIGSKNIFKCECGIKVDRDFNGARNIFLKSVC